MLDYSKVLQLYFEGVSQRTISASTSHYRNTVSEIVKRGKQHDLKQVDDIMTSVWLAGFFFPEKQATEKGYALADWKWVHKELQNECHFSATPPIVRDRITGRWKNLLRLQNIL